MDLNLFDAFNGNEKLDDIEIMNGDIVEQGQRKRPLECDSSDDETNLEHISKIHKSDLSDILPTFTNTTSIVFEGKNVTTFSAYPPHWERSEVKFPTDLAKEYKFELDGFQKQAISYIEKGESVLVAAHTSAGKTAVAEYAIAKSLRDGQKVVYTSPIKALSNQKFRDLEEEFKDVGLMTGDITLNPSATCLIMTTEILRSMLYRGSEVIREIAWVIYDEVHYLRDKERGIVWEESIVLLPHKVRFVFLSATIPNSREFAGWIAKIHYQPCHVVYTDYRPVPLQHYIFPSGGDGLHLVVDEKGRFRDDNFQKAVGFLQDQSNELSANVNQKAKRKNMTQQTGSDLNRIVKVIIEKNFEPAIVFSFSKRDCEVYAAQVSKLDFNDNDEKHLIREIFNNAIDSLSEDDKQLPQIVQALPLLKRGVAVHHGGLLPILKEIIEILFQEGLIKCLFATETFSIGINMPAKTVVFTSCRKFDGKDFRWVTSGEYIQMSGRAGRRGKDLRGIVIQMLNEKMEPAIAKSILHGEPDPLYSSYRISYNMLLNMLRVEGIDPEYMLRCSFHQYQQEQSIPELELKSTQFEEEANAINLQEEEKVAEYYQINGQLHLIKQEIKAFIQKPENCSPFLQPGRLIQIVHQHQSFGWGVVMNFKRNPKNSETEKIFVVEVLLRCKIVDKNSNAQVIENKNEESSATKNETKLIPCKEGDEGGSAVVSSFSLTAIENFSPIRIYLPKDTKSASSRESILRSLKETQKRFPDGLPLLNPVDDMDLSEPKFVHLLEQIQTLEKRQAELSTVHLSTQKDTILETYVNKITLLEKARSLRKEIRTNQSLVMKDGLKRMKRVLRKLGYTSQEHVIQLKGRTACEINTADELLVTELMFNGVLHGLSPQQCASLLSCLVYQEKRKEKSDQKIREELQGPYKELQETAKQIGEVYVECNIENIEVNAYVNSFNPELMDLIYEWCNGVKFVDLCKMTNAFPGTIIRSIRRLDELLLQLSSASQAIGNNELKEKFQQSSNLIKRDIVFAASLYL